jgi:DNA integrity scanning protein DisA with diadenylate cyclase activity
MNRIQRRKREKELKKIAQQIINLEYRLALDKDDKSAQNKIQEIMSALSTEEMLIIDDYIIGSRKLTK